MKNDDPKPVIQLELIDFPKFDLVISEFAKLHQIHYNSFLGSLARSYELVELYENLNQDTNYKSNPSLKDILRASVVFAHGTLEEFLRQLGIKLFLESDDVVSKLRDIPLANEKKQMRAEKFTLADLERFRGSSIDDLISKSVYDYYQRTTYNNVEDIINLLKILDISYENIEVFLPDMAAMIRRRHEIVHKTDVVKNEETQGEKEVTEIKSSDVLRWIYAVIIFIYAILFSIATKKLVSEGKIVEPPKLEIEKVKVSIRGKRLN